MSGSVLGLRFKGEKADSSAKPERREERGGRRVSETRGGSSYDRERERGTSIYYHCSSFEAEG